MAERTRPLRRKSALYAAIGVGVIAAVLIGVLATRSVPPGAVTQTSLLGKMAPQISGQDIVSKKPIHLSSLRGRFVLVDFFASWCQPCLEEAPALEQFLFEKRSGEQVAVLGVDIDDSSANGSAFLKRIGARWPAIEDATGDVSEEYGVDDPPQSFLISPGGRVVARVTGGVSAATLDSLIVGFDQRTAS